jgi:putative endonuclease
MPSPKRKIGNIGENIACKFLEGKGYKIIEKNYWKPWGEIDIVAEKSNILKFIEVKSVSRATVRPEENMHPGKVRRLHRAIQTYMLDRRVSENKDWQIDLVCVLLDFNTKKARVELLENIVL